MRQSLVSSTGLSRAAFPIRPFLPEVSWGSSEWGSLTFPSTPSLLPWEQLWLWAGSAQGSLNLPLLPLQRSQTGG